MLTDKQKDILREIIADRIIGSEGAESVENAYKEAEMMIDYFIKQASYLTNGGTLPESDQPNKP